MAKRITFTGVELLSIVRKPTEGTVNCRANFSSTVINALGWTEPSECMTGVELEGDLTVPAIELVPNDEKLRKHALELQAGRIHKFATVRREIENKRGKGHRTELHFKVVFNDPEGARKLENFMLCSGPGKLSASYEPAPIQDELPGTETESAQGELSEA